MSKSPSKGGPEPQRQGGTAQAPQQRPEQESALSQFFALAQRFLLMYFAIQFGTQVILPRFFPAPPPSADSPGVIPETTNGQAGPGQGQQPVPATQATQAWPLGSQLTMHVHFSTDPLGDVFDVQSRWSGKTREQKDEGLPSFKWAGITFGDWDEKREMELNLNIPWSVQTNASSLWADIFLTKDSADPDPLSGSYDPKSVVHVRKLLTRYGKKAKIRKEKNLLSGGDEEPEVEEPEENPNEVTIIPYWHSNLTLALISDAPPIPYTALPPPAARHIHLSTLNPPTYLPIIFPNDFWHLQSQLIPMNTSTPSLPLSITFQPMSYMKFNIFSALGESFEEAAKKGQGAELDEVKRMLVETNPWFLALTGLVSVLHTVFEMLAFKNDVSHWRKKDELVGVSVRTIITNVIIQFIILLYLIDNNTDTSWMILFGQGMGMLIEAWKVTKAVDIKLVPSGPGAMLPYRLDIKDKHVLSEDELKTQEYDKLAFRYVSYVGIPCLVGYTIYSLVYESHKGWYSFVISTLTSFVYMFGFVQLVPQLIINYKLKSVAHMPMKAMIYKTLSTVVDDFFAFCIKMPFLHRLACFRDDVVFLIFLYQRWIYRVDKKRVNEYGQVAVDRDEDENEVSADASTQAKESKKDR